MSTGTQHLINSEFLIMLVFDLVIVIHKPFYVGSALVIEEINVY